MLLSQIIVLPLASGPFVVFWVKRKVKTSLDQWRQLMCWYSAVQRSVSWARFSPEWKDWLGASYMDYWVMCADWLLLGSTEGNKTWWDPLPPAKGGSLLPNGMLVCFPRAALKQTLCLNQRTKRCTLLPFWFQGPCRYLEAVPCFFKIFYFILEYGVTKSQIWLSNWTHTHIVDLKCVSFRDTAKWFSYIYIYIYIHIHIYSFSDSSPM